MSLLQRLSAALHRAESNQIDDPRFPVADSPTCFFSAGNVGPVRFAERTLWLSYRLPVNSGDEVRVVFEDYTRRPRQALRISMAGKRDRLRINGHEGGQFILWADAAPSEVSIAVMRAGKEGALILSNAWEDEKYGTLMYGLNWTAVDVQPQVDGSVRLGCSDGFGSGPSFGDLVVRVTRQPGQGRSPAVEQIAERDVRPGT